MQPEETGALYFVATGAGDGAHHFSRHARGAQPAVQTYLAAPARSGPRGHGGDRRRGGAPMSHGRFITLEGIEGAGKSTVAGPSH